MPIPAALLMSLSWNHKEIVRLALQNQDLKIYAVASVSLAFLGETRNLPVLNLRGALVLSRRTTSRQCNLQLVDLHAAPGELIWRHDLSADAELVEEKQAERERIYALTDIELCATCIFADDVEASKFATKFFRTVHRGNTQQLAVELEQLHLDDKTIRAVDVRGGGQTPVSSVDLAQLSDTTAVQSDSVEKDGSSAADDNTGGLDNVNGQSPPEKHTTSSSTWIITINGVTCTIPDLTAELDSVDEIMQSESKYKLAGGCGIVRHARLKNGTQVAIKTIFTFRDKSRGFKKSKCTKERKRFRNEALMQNILSHPNVLPLLGIAEPEAFGLGASLVLPWMKNFDSFEYVKNNPQVHRLPLIHGAIRGVAFLHSRGIVHGDIKARNILISDDGTPLLSDFGLTTFADVDDPELSTTMCFVGSAPWMSIELHMSDTPGQAVTKHSDMWAFSMTVIELLTGAHPFSSGAKSKILSHNFENYPKRPQMKECTDKLWELVQSCWKLEPTSRPTAEDALLIIEAMAPSTTSGS